MLDETTVHRLFEPIDEFADKGVIVEDLPCLEAAREEDALASIVTVEIARDFALPHAEGAVVSPSEIGALTHSSSPL